MGMIDRNAPYWRHVAEKEAREKGRSSRDGEVNQLKNKIRGLEQKIKELENEQRRRVPSLEDEPTKT